jgi:cytochrome b
VHQVLVWDLATRLFHWLLVLFVVICLLTGEDEGLVFAIHAYAGFVILMLLFFRAGWGIIGSRHSRFADFIYPWSTTWRYALSFLRFKPQRYVGHNPLGGWMVILMLVVLTATALSGILMVTKEAGWLEDIHEALGSFMQILVFVHIAGVFVDRLLIGEKIVKAMITGHKELAEDAAQQEVPVAGVGRALAFAVLVVIGSVYLFQQIDYSAKVATFAANDEDVRKRKNDND